MGLLDGILGSVMGGGQGSRTQDPLGGLLNSLGGGNTAQSGNLLAAAMGMLQQSGGLTAVLEKFRGAGLASEADSWVSTGPNASISATHVEQIFGTSGLGNVASQLGLSSGQADSAMAKLLPELINQLTPQGQVPDDHNDLLTQALTRLRAGNA